MIVWVLAAVGHWKAVVVRGGVDCEHSFRTVRGCNCPVGGTAAAGDPSCSSVEEAGSVCRWYCRSLLVAEATVEVQYTHGGQRGMVVEEDGIFEILDLAHWAFPPQKLQALCRSQTQTMALLACPDPQQGP
jgi:hypothetical protein